MTATRPSPAEQEIIDRFGIFGNPRSLPYVDPGCKKRVTYTTEKDARNGLNKLLRQRAVSGTGPVLTLEQRYYWCGEHEGFHLTSKKHSGR